MDIQVGVKKAAVIFLNNTKADCFPKEATDEIALYFDSSSVLVLLVILFIHLWGRKYYINEEINRSIQLLLC